MIGFREFVETKEDPCWDGYQQYGMKDKNGKKVPNCIPKEEYKSDAQRKAVWAARKTATKLRCIGHSHKHRLG